MRNQLLPDDREAVADIVHMPIFPSSVLGKLHTIHRPFSLYHPPIVGVAWRLVNDLVVCVERTVPPEDHAHDQRCLR